MGYGVMGYTFGIILRWGCSPLRFSASCATEQMIAIQNIVVAFKLIIIYIYIYVCVGKNMLPNASKKYIYQFISLLFIRMRFLIFKLN